MKLLLQSIAYSVCCVLLILFLFSSFLLLILVGLVSIGYLIATNFIHSRASRGLYSAHYRQVRRIRLRSFLRGLPTTKSLSRRTLAISDDCIWSDQPNWSRRG